jgi:hypothetical protein
MVRKVTPLILLTMFALLLIASGAGAHQPSASVNALPMVGATQQAKLVADDAEALD